MKKVKMSTVHAVISTIFLVSAMLRYISGNSVLGELGFLFIGLIYLTLAMHDETLERSAALSHQR